MTRVRLDEPAWRLQIADRVVIGALTAGGPGGELLLVELAAFLAELAVLALGPLPREKALASVKRVLDLRAELAARPLRVLGLVGKELVCVVLDLGRRVGRVDEVLQLVHLGGPVGVVAPSDLAQVQQLVGTVRPVV